MIDGFIDNFVENLLFDFWEDFNKYFRLNLSSPLEFIGLLNGRSF